MTLDTFIFFALLRYSLFSSAVAETSPHIGRTLLERNQESECPRMYAPYVCSIRDVDGNHNCGGTVISEDAVITSAGCVDSRIRSDSPENPIIFIGGREIDNPVQERVAERIFYHDKWEGNPLNGYDIAIIKLNRPTCVLPIKFIGKKNPKQMDFEVFGYGRTGSSGEFSTELQMGHLRLISRSRCNRRFDLPRETARGTVCFQTAEGIASVCTGDEGGPIAHAPASSVYKDSLIAIASYTIGDCDRTNSVSVATNVRKFTGWINRTLTSEAFATILNTKTAANYVANKRKRITTKGWKVT